MIGEMLYAGFPLVGLLYLFFQVYALIRGKGAWRKFAILPLVITIPAITMAIIAFIADSNIWFLYLIFAFPFAGLYLIITTLYRYLYSIKKWHKIALAFLSITILTIGLPLFKLIKNMGFLWPFLILVGGFAIVIIGIKYFRKK